MARVSLTYRAMPALASMRTPVRGVDEQALEAAAKEWAKGDVRIRKSVSKSSSTGGGSGADVTDGPGRVSSTSLAVTKAIRTGRLESVKLRGRLVVAHLRRLQGLPPVSRRPQRGRGRGGSSRGRGRGRGGSGAMSGGLQGSASGNKPRFDMMLGLGLGGGRSGDDVRAWFVRYVCALVTCEDPGVRSAVVHAPHLLGFVVRGLQRDHPSTLALALPVLCGLARAPAPTKHQA